MSAAAQVVSEGGFIAAASRCNDGFPAHGNFKSLLFDHASPRALLDTIEAPGFSMYDQWEAQLLALIQLKARVGLFSELDAAEVRRAHLEPLVDVGAAVDAELSSDRARRAGGRAARGTDDDPVPGAAGLRLRGASPSRSRDCPSSSRPAGSRWSGR